MVRLGLPVNIVPKIVVAAVHDESTHGDAEREKHLAGGGAPHLRHRKLAHNRTHASATIALEKKKLPAHLDVQELAPSGQDEEEHSINGTRLHQTCHQQRQQNDVGERRGEINNLRIHFRSRIDWRF